MKNIYIKFSSLLFLIISFISCSAQTLPLNSALSAIPNYSYIKDLNNELNPYLGVFKAYYQDKEIELFIHKEEDKLMDYGNQKFYRDVLVVKYIVKNSSGQVLQDTQNTNSNFELYSTKISASKNHVIFYYSGTNCGVGWGDIYLKKLNDAQISWEYRPNNIVLDSSRCPAGTDITIYLPETKNLIFTKQ